MPSTKHWTTEPDGELNVKVLSYFLNISLTLGRERETRGGREKRGEGVSGREKETSESVW